MIEKERNKKPFSLTMTSRTEAQVLSSQEGSSTFPFVVTSCIHPRLSCTKNKVIVKTVIAMKQSVKRGCRNKP